MAYRQDRLMTKTPAEAFKACPYCGSTNLMVLDEDVFCRHCDWDSLAIHAELTPFAYHLGMGRSARKPTAKAKVSDRPSTKDGHEDGFEFEEDLLTCAN